MSHTCKIKSVELVTHDVKQFTMEKPEGFSFEPGQATEVSINKEDWKNKKRPFTFTSLNEDSDLEFTIKIYENHEGVTEQLGKLKEDDELIIREPWGTIEYKGPGIFLAGGAGVTPFIAILREQYKNSNLKGNRLFFSNKTAKDVILQEEFGKMLGIDFVSVLTEEDVEGHLFQDGFIDKDFLEKHIDNFDQPFYVCGPEPFIDAMMEYLKELGADPDSLVFEE